MKKLFFIIFWLPLFTLAQDSLKKSLQLLFVGDVMQHGGQIAGAYNAGLDAYDYRDCFQFVKPIIAKADIAIANLEVTHAGKPYKGYPQFSAPPELSEGLKDAGFDVLITANNHSCDGGAKGVVNTLNELDKLGIKHTGTFRNAKERSQNYPLMVDQKGFKIAILNYTYGTNGLSVAPPLIINYIDSVVMKADFQKAKAMGAEWIVCTLHWGTEYQSLPNDYQKQWEAFCYRNGADMVIGGHPHVLQPVETKVIAGETKLTAWSLGNFVSNQRDRYKDGGMLLMTNLEKTDGKVRLSSVQHQFTWVYPRSEKVNKPYYILPEFDYNRYRTDFLSTEAQAQSTVFFSDSRLLFQQHSKGTSESLVKEDASITDFYATLLTGYYAFELRLQNKQAFKLLSPEQQKDYHYVLGVDGNYHILSGYYPTLEALKSANSNSEFLNGYTYQKVWVTPTTFQVITE